MQISVATDWALALILLTLRLTPLFAFAPPFTLLNVPLRVRVLIPVMLAACLVQAPGARVAEMPTDLAWFSIVAASELVVGLGIAFGLQAAFAALYFAGRVLDVQAGFGLATVLDPATRAQTPLIGTVFAMAAATIFFAADAHHDLMRLVAASLQAVPVGAVANGWPLEAVIAQASLIAVLGLATAGAGILVLFLTDVALGFMSRTLPQMNILILGLQVKSIVLIFTLILMTGLLGPAFLRVTEAGLRFVGALES
jgi:flagellar biosynthetic protein FliR